MIQPTIALAMVGRLNEQSWGFMYDLIVRGGTVVDGSGLAPRRADVAVRDQRIVAVGRLQGERAKRVSTPTA